MIRVILAVSLLFVSTPVFSKIGDVYYCEMVSNTSVTIGGSISKRETQDFYFSIIPPSYPTQMWDYEIKIFGEGTKKVNSLGGKYPIFDGGNGDFEIDDYWHYRSGVLHGENFSFTINWGGFGVFIVTAYCNKT